MNTIRKTHPPAVSSAPATTLAASKQLNPRSVEKFLDAAVKQPIDARTLRRVVLNVLMMGTRPDNAGLVRWLDRNALQAVRASPPDQRAALVTQLKASGFPLAKVLVWTSGGMGARQPPRAAD